MKSITLNSRTRGLLSGAAFAVACTGVNLQAQQAEQYETPPVLSASQLLKPEFRSGPTFTVSEAVPTAGFLNQYIIVSDYGTFRAEGNALLVKRINEIQAIQAAHQITKSKAFIDSAVNSAVRPVGWGLDLIDEPVKTTGRTVGGVMKYVHRATEGVRRAGKKSEYESGALQAVTGMSNSTRQVAAQLGVDPYTTNSVLSNELESLGFWAYSGKLTTLGGYATIGGGWITPTAVVGSNVLAILHENLRDMSPVDIRRAVREGFGAMGMTSQEITAFADNPSLSPSHQLIILRSLEALGPIYGRDVFVNGAATAGSEADSVFFQINSQLILRYHERFGKVTHILDFKGLPALFTENNHLVLTLPLDYGSWSVEADSLSSAYAAYDAFGLRPEKRVIFVTGRVSPKVREKAQERGIEIMEDALGSMYIPEPTQQLPVLKNIEK